MSGVTINHIVNDHQLAARIFYHLSDREFRVCSEVNRTWYHAVKQTKLYRTFIVDKKLFYEGCSGNLSKLTRHAEKSYQFATEIDIHGWSSKEILPCEVYDHLINSKLRARKLILRTRGRWDNCHCHKEVSRFGKQIDPILASHITNLESIHVTYCFTISSCALLNLVARSPKLKTLKFYGNLVEIDHNEKFLSQRFLSSLDSLHWPWATSKQYNTISTLVKRNESITVLYCNSATVCDLLAAEAVPNLTFLSLNLNDRWLSRPENIKRGYRSVEKIKYLSTAKNVKALEVRSYSVRDIGEMGKKKTDIENLYDSYIITFWEQVAKLPKLIHIAVYGSWELEKICREMAKHSLQVEFLKLNLMPSSVITAIENQDDIPSFSMTNGIRYIRKLPKLRSLHLVCYEKLGTIDPETATAMKEILDLMWSLEIKVNFTEPVEDLLNNIMRRALQCGKTFAINLHIQTKSPDYADILVEKVLPRPVGPDLKIKLKDLADKETISRFGKPRAENFQVWGIHQTGNFRDKEAYETIASKWRMFNSKFETEARFT